MKKVLSALAVVLILACVAVHKYRQLQWGLQVALHEKEHFRREYGNIAYQVNQMSEQADRQFDSLQAYAHWLETKTLYQAENNASGLVHDFDRSGTLHQLLLVQQQQGITLLHIQDDEAAALLEAEPEWPVIPEWQILARPSGDHLSLVLYPGGGQQ